MSRFSEFVFDEETDKPWKLTQKAKKRLLKLRDLLLKDAKNKKGLQFDMGTWGEVGVGEKPGLTCNTRACALGLAALSGEFKRAGLGYELSANGQIWPTLNGVQGADTVLVGAEAFDIPHRLSNALFGAWYEDGDGAEAERNMAKIIKYLVKHG